MHKLGTGKGFLNKIRKASSGKKVDKTDYIKMRTSIHKISLKEKMKPSR